jgi:phage gpG-like protein
MIDIDIDDREIRAALQNLLAVTGNLDDVLTDIGEELVERTKQRFGTLTGPDGERWADNSPVTIERNDTLAVGSNMEYAAMQQFGGTKAEFPHLWGDIPARPFLGVSENDRAEILDIIQAHLRDAME